MQCVKCDHELTQCTCPDLSERVEALFASRFLFFTDEQKRELRERAERNKAEKEITE